MTTAATLGQRTLTHSNAFVRIYFYAKSVNKSAVLSTVLAGIFILYFLVPHNLSFTGHFFALNILYVALAPLMAFALSIWSLRQMKKNHNDRGFMLSMASLTITSLYFIVALATPLVLLGCYVVYAYLLK